MIQMQRSARLMTNTDAESRRILSQRIDWLYKNLPATAIGHLIGAIVTTGVLWRVTPRFTLLAWFACCASVTIPGFVTYRRYRRFGASASDPRAWVGAYVATTCLGGIAWGAAGFILFPPASLDYQAMLSLFLIGAAVGSVATDAVYFPAVAAFVVPCLIPLVIRLSLEAKEFYYWWAAGALFIMLFLLEAARNLEKFFVGALIAKQDAEIAYRQAARSNQEKTRFLAAASHDLRQPLTSLAINARLLGSHIQDAEGNALHENVAAAVEDLKRVLNGLLDISKLDAGVIEPNVHPMSVAVLFASMARAFEAEARAKELTLRIRSSPLTVNSDPVLLPRMLANLVSNAIHHTRSGGVLLCCRKRGDVASIEIWDTGVGIPGDQTEAIFQEFYQLAGPEKDRRKGLGLGLAIVRRIGDLLGHRIEVRSVVGKGSRFSLVVPLTNVNCAVESDPRPARWTFDPLLGASIGVIEDEASVRRDLEALLKQWGCLVVSAGSVIGLHEMISAGDLRLDAVISDFQLGNENGLEAIEQLRTRFGNVPAVLITGDTGPLSVRQATQKGIPVLQKPFEIDVLRETLRTLIVAAADETDSA